MDARIWLAAGYVLFMFGVIGYIRLLWAHWPAFVGLPFRDLLYNLVSHVPDDNRSAGLHILAGVLFTLGLAFVFGGAVVTMPLLTNDASDNSLFLTIAGLAFGVEISMLSFWTLWQTRRIEQNQGTDISNFPGLIEALGQEMDKLLGDLKAHNFSPRQYHRIYLVTTNPFFGLLSFPTEPFTLAFQQALRTASAWVARSAKNGTFDLQILCGDKEAMTNFHQVFFGSPTHPAASNDARVVEATNTVEKFIVELKETAQVDCVHRVKRVPKVQFAVIGNTVFEFVLENPGFQSEIHKARRIRERVMCDRFVETFQILKDLP